MKGKANADRKFCDKGHRIDLPQQTITAGKRVFCKRCWDTRKAQVARAREERLLAEKVCERCSRPIAGDNAYRQTRVAQDGVRLPDWRCKHCKQSVPEPKWRPLWTWPSVGG